MSESEAEGREDPTLDAPEDRDAAEPPEERDASSLSADAPLCDLCGYAMRETHCKLICDRCGYMRDCSDP